MGIFNKNYESAGTGIAKNAPKKTGSKLFFEILGVKFWKLIEVNMLYSLFFIPLILAGAFFFGGFLSPNLSSIVSLICLIAFAVLFGPATSGMTKVIRSFILDKHSFIMRDFFKAFKANFKLSAIIGFADCLVITSIALGMIIYPGIAKVSGNSAIYVLLAISISVGLTILIMNFYTFPMIIATDLSLINIVKNSFALTCIALKKNALTLLISVGLSAIMFLLALWNMSFSFLLPFFPAAFICFISCFNSYPEIQKYIINPYYASKGEINPELSSYNSQENETLFEDKGGKEQPIEKRKKGSRKRIS
ncbi:MAG: DUF624 domain-containing protein [Ruminococcus sp.]|nr:DUF624 domain-containing protein [Ruminococcus sp.]